MGSSATLETEALPIGIFDSGVGGLSVFKEIRRVLPNEDLLYFGDTARMPYGSKTEEELISYGLEISEFLIEYGAKALVLACNTSSATSYEYLQERLALPIIDVISPAIQPTLDASKNKRIGIIATETTTTSGAHRKAFAAAAPEAAVFVHSCPGFVPLVESGLAEGPEADRLADEYLQPLKDAGIDTLLLGCTHYPFLEKALRKSLGNEISIINPAPAVAEKLAEILRAENLLSPPRKASELFFTSGNALEFRVLAERFLGRKIAEIKSVKME